MDTFKKLMLLSLMGLLANNMLNGANRNVRTNYSPVLFGRADDAPSAPTAPAAGGGDVSVPALVEQGATPCSPPPDPAVVPGPTGSSVGVDDGAVGERAPSKKNEGLTITKVQAKLRRCFMAFLALNHTQRRNVSKTITPAAALLNSLATILKYSEGFRVPQESYSQQSAVQKGIQEMFAAVLSCRKMTLDSDVKEASVITFMSQNFTDASLIYQFTDQGEDILQGELETINQTASDLFENMEKQVKQKRKKLVEETRKPLEEPSAWRKKMPLVSVVALLATGVIGACMVPYPGLRKNSWGAVLLAGVFVSGLSYYLSPRLE
jgi:hypothetical protein